MTIAFQPSAFQADAFQIEVACAFDGAFFDPLFFDVCGDNVGDPIHGGMFVWGNDVRAQRNVEEERLQAQLALLALLKDDDALFLMEVI